MSPTWPRIFAASTSLIPKIDVTEVRLRATAAAQRVRLSTRARSIRRRSATSARAITLRSRSTTVGGRRWLSSSPAALVDSSVGAPPEMQITEQAVEPVDHPTALPGQLVTSVGQEPQHGAVVLGSDPAQVRLALGHPRHAGSVDSIGLAPVASSEEAGPGRQGRRHVQHGLLARDEPLGKEMTETRGTFDGPDPFGPALRPAQEPFEHGLVRWTSQLAEDATCFIERDRGVRRLVGIDADGDHLVPPRTARTMEHRGGQPEFEGSVSRL